MTPSRPWWKSLLLDTRALACGVVVAVVSVTGYVWVEERLSGGSLLSATETTRIAAIFSLIVALELLLFCVPLWLVLGRLRLQGWISAVLLGFAGPVAWVVWNDGFEFNSVRDGFPFGLCGVAAGLAVWWTRPKAASPLAAV